MRTVLSFCQGLPEKSFETGDVLLAEGESDKSLFVLIDGKVDVLKGQTLVNCLTEPGAIFGELSILLDVPHTATVKATVPTRTYMVDNPEVFFQSHPHLTYQLAKILARKLNSITTYLADLKNQYEDRDDHLGMVDEVLETLLHEQVEEIQPGSERYPDKTIF